MTRKQLENIYMANGLSDFKLNTVNDILKVHGIDYKDIDGYDDLDDLNKAIYKKFIINIFNSWNLDLRADFIPKGIYLAEEIDYIVKKDPDDTYYTVVGGIVYSIDLFGNKKILHEWNFESYEQLEKIVEKPRKYLRFEYQLGADPEYEWLQVIKGGQDWY